MIRNGRGTERDPVKALAWNLKAANKGVVHSMRELAVAHLEGEIVALNYYEALKWLERAAEIGDSWPQFNAGIQYFFKGNYHAYLEKSYRYLMQSEKPESYLFLGFMAENGLGTERNLESAYKWYTLASRENWSSAYAVEALKRIHISD